MASFRRPDAFRIGLVGLGSRGIAILERFVSLLRDRPSLTVEIVVFEPARPGPGLHLVDQPDYLLLNTVAGQLSVFPHSLAVAGTPRWTGPALDGWCRERGIRVDWRGHVTDGPEGHPVGPGDFLPRRLLGLYLEDCCARLLASAPPNVRVRVLPEAAVDGRIGETAARHVVRTASGAEEAVDALFLTIGHGVAAPATAMCEGLRAGESVAVAGLGLTAMDMVAAMTQGRGGTFEVENGAVRYRASGGEPKILLYSTGGRPYRVRPTWSERDGASAIEPVFLTARAIDLRRLHVPDGRLDFEADILPLIHREMAAVHHVTAARLASGWRGGEAVEAELRAAAGNAEAEAAAFAGLAAAFGPFDPASHTRIDPWAGARHAYADWFRSEVEHDLAEARLGVTGSPYKAALEVWRDRRDVLRHAVDGAGLTEASRASFYRSYAPLGNRLVGGPQKERHEDLLALVDAGIVTLLPPMRVAPGGGATHLDPADGTTGGSVQVDRHLRAFVRSSGLRDTRSALLRSLAQQGRLRPVADAGIDGIAVDRSGNPLRVDGTKEPTLWVLGPSVEGATFYNHYVATPAAECRLLRDAHREVARCIDRFEAERGRRRARPRDVAPA